MCLLHLDAGSKPGVQPRGGSGGRQHKASGTFVLLVVLLVLGGIFAAWYHFLATPAAKAQVSDLAGSVKSFGSSLLGLIGDKVAEWTGRGRGGLGGGRAGGAAYVPLDEELNYFQPLPAAGADAPDVVVQPAHAGSGGGGGGGGGDGVFTLR